MSMSDLWMREVERIGTRLAEGFIDWETAYDQLIGMGMDPDDAEAHCCVATGMEP